MVSILAAQQQETKRARRERLTAVRRMASELAVTNARHYVEAKKEQTRRVLCDLQANWEQSQHSKLSQTEALLFEVDRRRGEGMRNASSFAERQRAMAQQEAEAWRAEETLERQRFGVSFASTKLRAEQQVVEGQAKAARRERVREMEARRSDLLLQRREDEARNAAAIQKQRNVGSPFGEEGQLGAVALHCRDDIAATAEREAEKHAALRRTELQRKSLHLKQRQDGARQRARKAIEERRLEEERLRMKEEQEATAKSKLLEEALRRADLKMMTVDYQEQESRRATNLNRRLHLEFEETFLRGPWRDSGLGRTSLSEDQVKINLGETLAASRPEEAQAERLVGPGDSPTYATLFVPFAQLPSYHLTTAQWTDQEAVPAVADQKETAAGASDEVPRENSPIPQPQPSTEPAAAKAGTGAAPEPELAARGSVEASPQASETRHLRRQHERYLEELNRLRERIANNSLLASPPRLASLSEQHAGAASAARQTTPHSRPPLPPQPKSNWFASAEDEAASISSMSSPGDVGLAG